MENNRPTIVKSPLVVLGGLVALGLIISAAIGAYAFYSVRLFSGSLSVTGSASQTVDSDQVKWTLGFSRSATAADMSSAYDLMASDLAVVEGFFASHGVSTSSLDISPISMDEDYSYNYKSDYTPTAKRYNLRQSIVYSSGDVNGVTQMAKQAANLSRSGLLLQTQGLQYFYSKLADLRVSLLSDAIRDAKARASKLVEPSGQSVGPLTSASLGVVQVMAPNSIDISDYGTYDTSSIKKQVMVTVRAAFSIR